MPLCEPVARAVACRDPAGLPGRCEPHTRVGVEVLPISSGLGSDPVPGT